MTGILIIDKPEGWTSQDVVAKLRGILRVKRIGHGGTLDPMATGVLPVFIGRATRAVQFFENADKEYIAGLRLGITTDTQDITGKILTERPADVPRERLENVLLPFVGELLQVPPMYSAVKVGGQRLYSIARRGGEVERAPRKITVSEAEVLGGGGCEYILRFTVSKGTYIRTLCHDIGEALGTGGVMSSLCRTRAGAFSLESSVTLQTVEAARDEGTLARLLLPVDSVFADLPEITVSSDAETDLRYGRPLSGSFNGHGRYRIYNEERELLALGELSQDGIRILKSFFEV